MSRVHEPTISDTLAETRETLDDITGQLADIEHRLHQFGPSATLLRLKVSLELEQQECRRVLGVSS